MATEQVARPRGAVREGGRVRPRPANTAVEAPVEADGLIAQEEVGARVTPTEWALYGAFFVIGAIMRLWDLGSRAFHHDESLHGTYSWYLWERLTGTNMGSNPEYHYDPMMHGPYQFHGNALMYLLFGGPTNTAARLNAAICGAALILVPFLLRRQLGRVSALIVSALLAFSPAYLYYSRFTREDIYFALFTALVFVGLIRWLDARGRPNGHRWLYLLAAAYALSWATKESTFFITTPIILGFLLGLFVVGYAAQFLTPRYRSTRGRRAGHPLISALGSFTRANLPPVLDALRGTPARAWIFCLGLMAAIIVVLYWPIGDPWQWGFIPGNHATGVSYNTDAFTGGILYWIGQQGVARGSQPWYYYFLVIPLYEQVAVVFGGAGLVYFLMRRPTRLSLISGAAFLFFTLCVLFLGEGRLPKLVYEFLALLMILSGVALLVSRPRSLLVNLLLWWTLVTWGLYIFAGEKMPWLTLHILLPTFLIAALYLGHLFQTPRSSLKWRLSAVLLALCALVSFRSSVALAYVDGANPTEMLVYTQTSQDVPNVSTVIHQIPLQPILTGVASDKGRVCLDTEATWPWVWYLHDDPSDHCYTADENRLVQAVQQRFPVIILEGGKFDTMNGDGKLAKFAGYTPYKFHFNWWFPEDYHAWMDTGLGGFLGQAIQPSSWAHLWNWWLTRAPFDQGAFDRWDNSRRMYVYIRSDLIKRYIPSILRDPSWQHAQQLAVRDISHLPSPTLPEDVVGVPVRPVLASVADGAALRQPLAVIRAVAIDRAGAFYLTDSTTQRVVKLDPSGHYVTSWGSAGSKPGQFGNAHDGPMGLAVGRNGHIYVADTWNHRIQEFTPNGVFVHAFGGPNPPSNIPTAGSFFGPRQIAVAPNGNLYIADTGNERIQVYSPAGTHLFNLGTAARTQNTALGSFNEPSGVAVDNKGIVYVADYWNKRIQRFTPDGKPLGAFPVAGWANQDYSEPYLATDNNGHLFATDAPSNVHVNHVLELDATTGTTIRAFGTGGTAPGGLAQPSGIAVGPDGTLYIADAGTIKLMKVRP